MLFVSAVGGCVAIKVSRVRLFLTLAVTKSHMESSGESSACIHAVFM